MPDSVEKFGGTSVANPEALLHALDTEVPDEAVLVLSAIGKITPDSTKMTDLLIQYGEGRVTATEALAPLDEIAHKHLTSGKAGLLLDQARHDIEYKEESPLWSRGERWTSEFYSQLTGYPVVDAAQLIAFRGLLHGHSVDESRTNKQIQNKLSGTSGRVIIPGYYGRGRWLRDIRTFDRGGSDVTGAILAGSLDLPYTNWTDQDGIRSADPRTVANTSLLKEISIEEIRELGNGGSGVFDRNTAGFLERSEITTTLRNTFNTEAPGTRISPARESMAGERPVVAISARDDICMINVHATGMNERSGYAQRILGHLAKFGISWELMPTTADRLSIGYHLEDNKASSGKTVSPDNIVDAILSDKRLAANSVSWSAHSVVYMVGQQLRDNGNRTETMQIALQKLNEAGINAQDMITTPNSAAIGILLPKNEQQMNNAQKILHKELIG